MVTIILAILIFGLLILAHELGHFLAAKWVGIKVHEFAIGMGPAVVSKPFGETRYSLRLFPIGGFNKMAGMEPGDENNPRGFNAKSIPQRTAVIGAGSLMNFVLAVILFIFVFAVLGVPSNSNVIGKVSPNSPAWEAGLQSGDKIVAIEGQKVTTWGDLVSVIHNGAGEQLLFSIERKGEAFSVEITPQLDAERELGLIGIRQSVERKGLVNSVILGVTNTVGIIAAIFSGLFKMLLGTAPAEVAGPVGIVTILDDVARFGLANVLNFAAILSLNLGLINLFPVPALDGSRLVFLLFEGLRGKPVDPVKENVIHLIGFALLIGLMIFITYQDILRILG